MYESWRNFVYFCSGAKSRGQSEGVCDLEAEPQWSRKHSTEVLLQVPTELTTSAGQTMTDLSESIWGHDPTADYFNIKNISQECASTSGWRFSCSITTGTAKKNHNESFVLIDTKTSLYLISACYRHEYLVLKDS